MKKKWKQLRQYIEKNDRRLVVIGAFMFFATFVFKDIVREEMKDLKDSLAEAENISRMRHEFLVIEKELKPFDARVRLPESAHVGHPGPNEPTAEELGKRMYAAEARWKEYSAAIDEEMGSIEDLVSTMNLGRSEQKDYDEYVTKIKPFRGNFMVEGPDFHHQVINAEESVSKAQDIEKELFQDSAGILREAHETELARADRYKIVKVVSYILFGAASAIALVGKIFGTRGVEPE